ncbi:hypothetical protein GCM10012280_49610 [Wenjunlia tyrosinilytica]|uniref:MacB-like periplasmic core domain-containing protein n=1 Tax=Wenjunlia tyrosinilytica TaxID=1544741 RepID=A0A917ZUG5_9ACTN|nr:hypothetical protein GCM10012280_49610 [Wenjunlia tyrosinilytica]
MLGVGAFIAVLGLTSTTASQNDARFNKLTATQVTVKDSGGGDAAEVPLAFPQDADARIGRLNGVTAAGVYWKVRLSADQTVGSTPLTQSDDPHVRTDVIAASPGLLDSAGPHLAQGRVFDSYHDSKRRQVAVLGSAIAVRLGITTLDTQPAVFIGNTPFTVIGILDDVVRKPELLLSVVVPRTTAEHIWGPAQRRSRRDARLHPARRGTPNRGRGRPRAAPRAPGVLQCDPAS